MQVFDSELHAKALPRLANAARVLAELKADRLNDLKSNASDLERDDFIWHYLLQSFATLGGSSGWKGLIANQKNYSRMAFDVVGGLSEEARIGHAAIVFRAANVRYPERKSVSIIGCFDRIQRLGGLLAAKSELERQDGRNAKIRFMKAFPGIGNKYARNILMDVYHPDFHDSIAIDSRIQNISDAWSLVFEDYAAHEEFFLTVASNAGLNGWELDRLLYQYTPLFLPPLSLGE